MSEAIVNALAPQPQPQEPWTDKLGRWARDAYAAYQAQPSWLDRATAQSGRDRAAFQSGGVPALMANTAETADLAGGFGGTTTGKFAKAALPMDEASRVARAAQQGYNIDAYHGTGSAEFPAFDASKVRDNIQYGGNFYFTPSAEFANKHTGPWSGDSPRIMPVKLKADNPYRMDQPITAEQAASVLDAAGRTEQAKAMRDGGPLKYWTGSTLFYHGLGQETSAAAKADAIRKAGYDAIIGDPQKEIAGTAGRPHIMVFEPDQIRSKFAAFDPASKGSGNLLGSLAGLFGLGALTRQGQTQQ